MDLTLRRLTPRDIDQIIEIDRKTFPENFLNSGVYRFNLSCLLWAELKGKNYSVGVLDGDRLVGYLIMVGIASMFHPGQEVVGVLRIAVLHSYRREVVGQLIVRYLRNSVLIGRSIEGQMRALTSFRMIQRTAKVHHLFGYRITAMKKADPIAGETIVLVHGEHIFFRDPVLRPVYKSLTWLVRQPRILSALPRRVLRKACTYVPPKLLPAWLRRLTYLEQRDIELLVAI